MPTEERGEMSAQDLGAKPAQRRPRAVEQLAIGLAMASLAVAGVQFLISQQSGAWQPWIAIGGAALSFVLMAVAWSQARRERTQLAGYLVLLGVLAIYGSGELALSGATVFFLIGALLLILLIGSIALPRQWGLWLIAAGLYAGFVLLINRLEPLPRYNVVPLGFLTVQLVLVTILLTMIAFWQMIRAWRGVGTIRTRLLVSFVVMVFLTALGVGSVSIAIGYQYSRQRVMNQLSLLTSFKASQLDAWVQDLQDELASLAFEEGEATVSAYSRILLTSLRSKESEPSVLVFSALLRSRLQEEIDRTHRFDDMFLLDREGTVVVSTDISQEGLDLSGQPYFEIGLRRPLFQPPFPSSASGQMVVVVAQPLSDQFGNIIGLLGGRVGLDAVEQILDQRTGLGRTGVTYLVGADYAVLPTAHQDVALSELRSPGIDRALTTQGIGAETYRDYQDVPVVGAYRWLRDFQGSLLGEQAQIEAFRAVYSTLAISVGVAVLFVLLAVVGSLFLTRSIADPLADLAETATRIAHGDLSRSVTMEREDEIGTLAQAFSSMTTQLRALISSLEQRVVERTNELARRSAHLEAAASVGRAAASILDADELIHRVVDLIAELFGFYYVGLFLVDESGRAVLRAGASSTEHVLPALGQRLPLDGDSMISWSIANRRARVAQEVDEDLVHVSVPELPDTRSEVTLPLQSRGQVLGALSVQHVAPNAFDEDIVVVLQTMADQVAAALANARLFAERQEALEAAQRAYGELSRQAWRELLRARADLGYRSDESGVADAGDVWRPEMEQALLEEQVIHADAADSEGRIPLAAPIRVRGEIVGVLDAHKRDEAGVWTQEEIALVEAVVEQVGIALESARLYQDSQRRAAREQLVGEITARMRETLSIDTVLQTTLRELGTVFDIPKIEVRMRSTAVRPGDGRASPARAEGSLPQENENVDAN